MNKNLFVLEKQLQELPRKEILALAAKVYDKAKAQVKSGQVVTQENIAILNRARAQLKAPR